MPPAECPEKCYAGVLIDGPSEVRVCPGCHVPHEEIGGPGAVLAACGGVSRSALMRWRRGERLADRGPFPEPIRQLEGTEIWDLRDVRAWHEQ